MNLRHGLGGIALVSVCLSGCIFDDSDPAPTAASTSEIRLAPVGSEALLAARISSGKTLVAGGDLRSQQMIGAPVLFSGVEVMADGSGMAPSAGAGGGGTGGAMTGDSSVPADDGLNNVQVTGVEEADLVKSDGEFLYVAEQPDQWIYPLPVEIAVGGGDPVPVDGTVDATLDPVVRSLASRGLYGNRKIVPRDGISASLEAGTGTDAHIARYQLHPEIPGATALPSLTLPGGTGYIANLKLLLSGGDTPRLVAMGQSGNYWSYDRWFSERPFVYTQETRLWIFDVANQDAVPAPTSVVIKGELVDSRRVDNHLYLVTRYAPTPGTDPLVPMLSVSDTGLPPAEGAPLLPPAECLVPGKTATGYPSLTFVVAIDLADPTASKSACYSGEVYTMYMSRDAVYLAAQRYNPSFDWNIGTVPVMPVPVALAEDGTTVDGSAPGTALPVADDAVDEPAVAPVDTLIHRFALNGGDPEYTGSGIVAGGFTGWMGTGSNPQWRFHERNGLLYVVTSWWDSDELHHHLNVLEPDDAGNLIVAATLPNAEHPEPIGKPREDIFAMRYVGDRAYIVTFQQTDPLYVISLADPLHPVVAGSLMLPGFSAYLHPVGADWLLGIGRGGGGRTGSGIEANLFDVRDPANPLVHGHVAICASCDAPILTDYHAIAVLARDGVVRVGLPLQSWATADEFSWRPVEQAALLEVAVASGQLSSVGVQNAAADHTALGRVLLIADAVFQPQKGAVTFGSWPVPLMP